jgi:glycosyltransferase involved in cell wall biosynthesis
VATIENLPLTLIEALAYAKPILAAAVGGVPELFADNVHGRTLPLGDANEAAKIVIATLKDKTLLAKFGDAARRHYASNFEQKLLGNRLSEFILRPMKTDGTVNLPELRPLKKRTVVIVQRCITVYRVPLFEHLKILLEQDGIQLRLLYGDATIGEQTKRDTVDIVWGEKLNTRYLWGNRICWQPFSSKVRDADLVIVTQENKLVSNLWPLFGWRKYKLAFWGHGKNMQVLPTFKGRSKEQVKFLTTNRVDWWFLYTNANLKHVVELGFSAEKMTNLENSIDTATLKAQCEAVTSAEIATIRSALDLGNGPIGLYVGSLYKDKRLDFLISAGKLLSQKIPSFSLIVLGDGPQSALINNAQAEYPWLRFVGRQVGQQKAQYLKTASVLLNPGLLGLSILDGFAAGVPIVTTDCGLHSPEIDYLQQGVNGFMTANNLEDYVQTVERILTDSALAFHLQNGCLEAAKHYTIENMAENFRAGILKALS